MNYLKLYNSIIVSRKAVQRIKGEQYYEAHHIIPRSIGGSDDNENLVLLTAKEHFICHHLLTKIYSVCSSLKFAFWSMCNQNVDGKQLRVTHRTYQSAKEQFALANSRLHKGKTISEQHKQLLRERITKNNLHKGGVDSHLYGTHWPEERKLKVSQTKKANPENNGLFKGWYITPFGKYASCHQAKESIKTLSYDQIYDRCKKSSRVITKTTIRYCQDLTEEDIGKTFKEIGWYFLPVDN